MKKYFKSAFSIPVLILLLSLILTIIWFHQGNILGTGESGLPFYNLQLEYDNFKTAWARYALGGPTNITIASKPSYWFLAQIQNSGIPPFIIQGGFFWLILIISGFSIYFITKIMLPDLSSKFLIIAVFFYWFNPWSMVNVWNRFLNNFFVFYMFFPLSLLLFLKGLQTRKYIFALIFGLASLFFSYASTSLAFNLLLWFMMFYASIFYFFTNKDLKFRFFIIKFFLITILFWFMINIWWISQTLSYVFSGSFSSVQQTSFSSNNNHQIFTILSQKLGNLVYVLRFEHGSFFSKANDLQWVKLYTFPVISLISFGLSLIIFLPVTIKRRNFAVIFLTGLTLLGIFLSKGNTPPFGDILDLVFSKAGFLQVFRNPFEKFGFILPLSSAPLFAYGIYLISEKLSKYKNYIYLISLLWLTIIWGFPYWTGLIFTSNEYPDELSQTGYQTKVPVDYQEATKWLSSQKDDFRLLAFPIGGEGMTYNWEKGYTGVELTNQLLPVTSVSFQTNIPFYENISADLEKAFLDKTDFTRITNILNAKYIMTRDDIDWHARRMRDPQAIFNELKKKDDQFKLVKTISALSFWENPGWVNKSVYASNGVALVSTQPKISDAEFLPGDSSVMIGDKTKLDNISIEQEIIHPVARLSLEYNLDKSYTEEQDIFPYVRFSPTSSIYPLLLFKERLELDSIPNISDKFNAIIKLLGKRLVEAKQESGLQNKNGVSIAISEYINLLNYMSVVFPEYSSLKYDIDKQLTGQEKFYRIFLKHKLLIQDIMNSFPADSDIVRKLKNAQEFIDSKLVEERIEPAFGFKEANNFSIRGRVAYKFNITNPGEYELMWGGNNFDKYYKGLDSESLLQVDDKLLSKKAQINQYNLRSFGKFYFNPGVHELAMNTPLEKNLVDAPNEMDLKVDHEFAQQAFGIKDYDPQAAYTISFDYFIKKGSGVDIFMQSNNSLIKLGEVIPDFLQTLSPESYDFDTKHYSNSFKLNNTLDSLTLFFRVKPWNNCESIFRTSGIEKCKNDKFRSSYDRITEVLIKNVTVTRKLTDEPVLIKSNALSSIKSPSTNFQKIDNTSYKVSIKSASRPYILVLSELYDPGWEVFTTLGERLPLNHFLANSYANGWEIDKIGDYELIIKYLPQDILIPTEKISEIVAILTLIFLIWIFGKKYVKKSN